MKKKTIYIPIEIKAREFVSQVLLAGKIAEVGGRVYLGTKSGVSKALITKPKCAGTLLYKGGMGTKDGFKELRKLVDKIAVLDQEMSPAHPNQNPARRFVEGELAFVDRLYYVGSAKATNLALDRSDLAHGKVLALGWPRVDLWGTRYLKFWEVEAEAIRERFGNFVLFSSDFGFLHGDDVGPRLRQKNFSLRFDNEVMTAALRQAWSTVREFDQVISLLSAFDRDPSFPMVVVRPHPNESISRWIDAVEGMHKTQVVGEGDVTPWLYASIALLHRGCTTALQAEALGKPTGFLKTRELNSRKQATLVSAFSKSIATVQDGLDLVNPGYKVPKASISSSQIANLDGTASEKIAADLLALTVEPEDKLPPLWRTIFGKRVFDHLIQKVLNRLRRWAPAASFSIPSHIAVHKMPGGVRVGEVRDVLERLGMDHFTARQTGKDLVCVEQLGWRNPLFVRAESKPAVRKFRFSSHQTKLRLARKASHGKNAG